MTLYTIVTFKTAFLMSVSVCKLVYRLLASQLEKEWQLKRKNHDQELKPVTYALTQSFSHASQSGHNSLSPIAIDMAMGGP